MKVIIKRYRYFIGAILVVMLLTLFNFEIGIKAFSIAGYSFKEMAMVIPPVFVLLGLLDVWVPRETMMKYMGEGSGIKGVVLSIILGSAAAGPLYGAFPIAAVFMRKGVKFTNILIFIGAWSTTKIPMFLFEMSALGSKFAITRLFIDIPGIIIIAYLLSLTTKAKEVEEIYNNSAKL
jgi:uncharacterized membrane protein YraQ (UPF0718 family)